jgi:hypothetical protein
MCKKFIEITTCTYVQVYMYTGDIYVLFFVIYQISRERTESSIGNPVRPVVEPLASSAGDDLKLPNSLSPPPPPPTAAKQNSLQIEDAWVKKLKDICQPAQSRIRGAVKFPWSPKRENTERGFTVSEIQTFYEETSFAERFPHWAIDFINLEANLQNPNIRSFHLAPLWGGNDPLAVDTNSCAADSSFTALMHAFFDDARHRDHVAQLSSTNATMLMIHNIFQFAFFGDFRAAKAQYLLSMLEHKTTFDSSFVKLPLANEPNSKINIWSGLEFVDYFTQSLPEHFAIQRDFLLECSNQLCSIPIVSQDTCRIYSTRVVLPREKEETFTRTLLRSIFSSRAGSNGTKCQATFTKGYIYNS